MTQQKKKSSLLKADLFDIQKPIAKLIRSKQISIITAPAGSAKDFICLYTALDLVTSKQYKNIIITKPIIEVGKSMGFLPGDLNEKLDPYRKSFDSIVDTILGKGNEGAVGILKKKISFEPINFVRGNTYANSVLILSEAQNCTLHELISFMTRLDKSSIMFLNGDMLQSDIGNKSGLGDLIQIINKVEGIEHITLGDEFQTRNPMIVKLNKEYIKYKGLNNK